jgi:hypothetical protein
MEKMLESGIPLRKQIAMGMHEEMYKDGGKMEAKSGKKKPKKAKPPMGRKKGGY